MSETLKQLKERHNKLGLSRTELAKELNLSLATLDRMLAKGEDLPAHTKVGRQYLFLLTDIARFFEKDRDEGSGKKEEPG